MDCASRGVCLPPRGTASLQYASAADTAALSNTSALAACLTHPPPHTLQLTHTHAHTHAYCDSTHGTHTHTSIHRRSLSLTPGETYLHSLLLIYIQTCPRPLTRTRLSSHIVGPAATHAGLRVKGVIYAHHAYPSARIQTCSARLFVHLLMILHM